MNRPYRELFETLPASDALRQEVRNMVTQDRAPRKFSRLPKGIAIAALTAALLAGTAFAANMFRIRDLFAQKWRAETGQEISVDQLGLIDQLTQEVGASDTDNGITVTVDSVTRGEGILWLLLEIDSETPLEDSAVFFRNIEFSFSPEIETGTAAFSFEDSAVRENGSLMTLLRYVPTLTGENTLQDSYDVSLRMKNLYQSGELAAEGNWEIGFSLAKTEVSAPLTPEGSVVVRGISLTNPAPVTVEYSDIRITPTEVWLHTDAPLGDEVMVLGEWGLQMKDGSQIIHSGGATYDHPNGGMESVYYWRIPVNLSDVAALTFGDQAIPIA